LGIYLGHVFLSGQMNDFSSEKITKEDDGGVPGNDQGKKRVFVNYCVLLKSLFF
jgi:hypothetical protein